MLLNISWYILYQLKKKTHANDTEAIYSPINSNDSEKTCISEYAGWTTSINRGGLKIPSDNFYLFVRES